MAQDCGLRPQAVQSDFAIKARQTFALRFDAIRELADNSCAIGAEYNRQATSQCSHLYTFDQARAKALDLEQDVVG